MPENTPVKRSYVLVALMLTMMLAAMDITIVSTAIPQIVSDLGGFKKFSWVFSIYLLAQTVTIPVYGKLSDLFGRKKVILTGVVIFLIGSATSAAAWNIESLIIFRGLQGLGAGSIMATVNTIAGDLYTVSERAKIQGWLSSIWGISAIIGPALGGALAEFVNWRWIFIINIPIGIISILFLWMFFKENIVPKNHKIDYKGAILILITLTSLIVFLLESGQSWPWLSMPSVFLFLWIIIFLWLTIQTEKKAKEPILPVWVFKNPTFAFTNIAMVCMGIVMMGPETYLPTFTQASLGVGIIASGFILASMSIGWPTASALSGRIYMRIGFRNTSLIGTIIMLASCISFLFIPWPQPVYLIVLLQIMLGAGFGLLSTPTLVGVQSMVAWEQRGVITGMNVFSRNLGQSLGATIFGAIFNHSFEMKMKDAPENFNIQSSNVLQMIYQPELSKSSKVFLQKAISFSMHHVYIGLSCFALFTLLAILYVPNKKPSQTIIKKADV